jgi:phenylacetate-CoA ligase
MHGWLVPRVVLPVYERVSGRRFWTEVRRLRARQWSPPDELEERVVERLRHLLAHAGTHVPYYRELFRAADLDPRSIRSVEDLARVPITTRAALRRGFPDRVTARNLPTRRRQFEMTSGSMGLPLAFYRDRGATDTWIGAYLFFLEWAGTAFWNTEVVIAGPRHFYPRRRRVGPAAAAVRRWVLGREQIWLGGPTTTVSGLWSAIARSACRRPYHLWAYPSYASRLARELLQGEGTLPVPPRAVIAAAETLTPVERQTIAQAFRAPVPSHYSCVEIPRLAQTCPDNSAVLHVNAERAIVRVVDTSGRSVAPGQAGRVLVTDLVNEVMPFINYDPGDTATLGLGCPCGRGWPTLSAIEGRTNEMLVTGDGRRVSAATLGMFLNGVCGIVPFVWEYQAIQEPDGAVELRLVPTAQFTREAGDTLARQLATLLGPDVPVRVTAIETLERAPSGKRLVIRSAWANAPGRSMFRSTPDS